jgi:transposase
MSLRHEILPTDPEQLVELVLELAEENERLRAALKTINTMHFGAKSERIYAITKQQMALDLADLVTDASPLPANDDQPEATKAAPRRPRQPAHRNVGSLAKHLPRCERVIEPDSTICPCCACQMRRIGESVHEALDVVPAILRVLRTIRPKYACRGCESTVVQAPAPPRPFDAGMASTALVSWVVASKFAWHVPLHRQTQILAGYGVTLDRSTLVRWVDRAAWWLLRRNPAAGAREGTAAYPKMPVLGAWHRRSTMERAGAPGGRLCLRLRARHRGDRRADRQALCRRAAGRWLWRLQGAGQTHRARPHPAGVLPRACAPEICRGAQGHAIAGLA